MSPRNQKEIEALLSKDEPVEPPADLLRSLKLQIPDRFTTPVAAPTSPSRERQPYLRVAALLFVAAGAGFLAIEVRHETKDAGSGAPGRVTASPGRVAPAVQPTAIATRDAKAGPLRSARVTEGDQAVTRPATSERPRKSRAGESTAAKEARAKAPENKAPGLAPSRLDGAATDASSVRAQVQAAGAGAPVTAVVTDASGQPLSGANVTLIGDGLKQSAVSDTRGRASFTNASEATPSSSGGVASFVGGSSPANGNSASSTAKVSLRMALSVVQGIASPAEPSAESAQDSKGSGLARPAASFDESGRIDGLVTDALNAPLPGATVTLSGGVLAGDRIVTSNASGEFHFLDLPPGRYALNATISGFVAGEKALMLRANQEAPVDFNLEIESAASELAGTGAQKARNEVRQSIGRQNAAQNAQNAQKTQSAALFGRVAGTITDANEMPVDNVLVTLTGAGFSRLARTDPRGRFEFTGLPDGDYRVEAGRAGFAKASEDVQVNTQQQPLRIQLQSPYNLPPPSGAKVQAP